MSSHIVRYDTYPPAIQKQHWHSREAQIEPPLFECMWEVYNFSLYFSGTVIPINQKLSYYRQYLAQTFRNCVILKNIPLNSICILSPAWDRNYNSFPTVARILLLDQPYESHLHNMKEKNKHRLQNLVSRAAGCSKVSHSLIPGPPRAWRGPGANFFRGPYFKKTGA